MTVQKRGNLDESGMHDLIELVSSPSPAMHVRVVLQGYRQRGAGFEYAWAQSMRTLPRTLPELREWKTHFHAQKEMWRRAYDAAPQADVA